jgi:hypothetical protein
MSRALLWPGKPKHESISRARPATADVGCFEREPFWCAKSYHRDSLKSRHVTRHPFGVARTEAGTVLSTPNRPHIARSLARGHRPSPLDNLAPTEYLEAQKAREIPVLACTVLG